MASRMLARLRRQRKYRYYYVIEFSTGLQVWSSCSEMLERCMAQLPVQWLQMIVAYYCIWKLRNE